MAFTNGQGPRIVGTVSGAPVEYRDDLAVNTSTTAVTDFVVLTSGAWAVYAANGTSLGGIYVGRDAGSITSGAVVIPTPGKDAKGAGVSGSDGPVGAAATLGQVALLTPDCLVEIDIVEGATMANFVPGLTAVELAGATRVSASSGGWYIQENAGGGTDSACTLVEVLRDSTATTHGRAVVRFNTAAVTCQFA